MTETFDLELRSLVKNFGASRAVDHIDLRIRKGEFVSPSDPAAVGRARR